MRKHAHTAGIITLLSLVWLLVPVSAIAGAWGQSQGHGEAIMSFSVFETSRYYGSTGTLQPFSSGGKFRQLVVNPYLEYGLKSGFSVAVNTQIPFLRYSNAFGVLSSAGLGDTEISIKKRLNSADSYWAVSSQITLMLPLYSARRNPAPGNHKEDIEARFLFGHGSKVFGRHTFWDAQLAYRSRFGAPADQFRADLTAGIDLTPRLMPMIQFFNIRSLRNGQPIDSITNPNAQSDFDLYKCQASLVIKARRGMRIQGGWGGTLAGRNTGAGATAFFALWQSF
jgi:hypothetical protein